MLPYWLLFVLWAMGAVQSERRADHGYGILFYGAAAIATTLMIGLRFEVGGDWGAYRIMYERTYFLSLSGAAELTDPGYAAINWLAAQGDLGVTFVNFVCACLFMGGFSRLAWKQPNPALAVLVAVPYLIIVVAMGYTRQAAAIGIICFAMADASERNLAKTMALIGVAALFHKTALLILPIILIPIFRRNVIFGVLGAVTFLVLFVILLRDTSDQLLTNYVQGNYDSQGAAVRVSMNVLAALLFLLFRARIDMPSFQKSFWTACALLSIASIGALAISSASSGVDRISLYLIPLQSIIYSRLPYMLKQPDKALPSALLALIGYAFLVQLVWLNRADNANYWLPYSVKI